MAHVIEQSSQTGARNVRMYRKEHGKYKSADTYDTLDLDNTQMGTLGLDI
jgi:hypothetical protein